MDVKTSAVMGGVGDYDGDVVVGVDILGRKHLMRKKRRPGGNHGNPAQGMASALRSMFRPHQVMGRVAYAGMMGAVYGIGAAAPKPKSPFDGIFGPGTKAQVVAFQRKRGLMADGIAGAKTLAALGLPATTTLKQGSRGPAVMALQQKLAGFAGQSPTQKAPGAAPSGPVKTGSIITITPDSYLQKAAGGYLLWKTVPRAGKTVRVRVAKLLVSPSKSAIVIYPFKDQAVAQATMLLIRNRLPPVERGYGISIVPPKVVRKVVTANAGKPVATQLANTAMAAAAAQPVAPPQDFIPPPAPVVAATPAGPVAVSEPGGGGAPEWSMEAAAPAGSEMAPQAVYETPNPEAAPYMAPPTMPVPDVPEYTPAQFMPEQATPPAYGEYPVAETQPVAEEAYAPTEAFPDQYGPEAQQEAYAEVPQDYGAEGQAFEEAPASPDEAQVQGLLWGTRGLCGQEPPPVSWDPIHPHGLIQRGYGVSRPGTGLLSGLTPVRDSTGKVHLAGPSDYVVRHVLVRRGQRHITAGFTAGDDANEEASYAEEARGKGA